VKRIFILLILLICSLSTVRAQAHADAVTAITGVTVIDMTGSPAKAGMTVIIRNGRIRTIGRTSRIKIPDGARVIDGRGKFLIPAFWDMHVHFFDYERTLRLFVANGVLGVRELGGPMDKVLGWRADAESGKIISPRIVTAGRILDGDPPSSRPEYTTVVRNVDEARRAVRDLHDRGVDLIKVYDALPSDAYFAIADEAKKFNMPFVGHTPTAVTTLESSNAGQKSIEHLGKILEESSGAPDKVAEKRNEAIAKDDFFAFTTRLGRVHEVVVSTYSRRKAATLFSQLRRNRTWQVPTLVVKYERTFIDQLDAKGDERTKYLPAADVSYWKPNVNFFSRYRTASYIAAQKKYYASELRLVGDMNRAGVGILAGTDCTAPYVFPGFGLHDELALLVEAGLTPMQALQTATRNPADYLNELDTHGTIEEGKLANLILLDKDPLAYIKNSTSINAVIQRGYVYSRQDLDRMLADVETLARKK
jgi:hypothetical protein